MSLSLAQSFKAAIAQVIGPAPATLHEPCFAGNEWVYLKECLDSTYVSSGGKFVDRFEADLAAYTGAKHAVAVVNGTAALQVALRLAGVQPLDEALIPTLTFVATGNAVAYCGATPHFVDSEESTLGVDPRALRSHLQETTEIHGGTCVNRATGRVIRALVPMHTFGHPVDIEGLLAVARDFKLALIEDAAESLGSTFHGRHTGTFGMMGTLSFNGNKTITAGGGGAILTNEPELAKRAKHLTTTAKVPDPWHWRHDEVGYNYRLPNINAALGCAQLEVLEDLLARKRKLAMRYRAALAPIQSLKFVDEPAGCRSNFWLNTVLLREASVAVRDSLLAATNDAGYMTRPAWTLLHKLPMFADCPRVLLPVAERLEASIINVPSSPGLVPGDAK